MSTETDSDSLGPLQVHGSRVVLGDWSGDLEELVAADLHLRQLLRDRRWGDARALVQAQPPEAQAALVCMDENPEEVLSLTAMDEQGRPGYRPGVIAHLPGDLLAELLVPRQARHDPYNLEVLRRMPAKTLARSMEETLAPVSFQEHRTRVCWEWLEIVAALDDPDRAAALLLHVDESLLVEAFLDKVDSFAMDELVAAGDDTVYAFRLLAEEGEGAFLPRIEDPEVAEVVHRLHQAAPELIARALRLAWERAGGPE